MLLRDLFSLPEHKLAEWLDGGVPWFDYEKNRADVFAFRSWYEKEQSSGDGVTDLRAEKLKAEIAYKEAQIQKIKEETIPRAEHDMILSSRASSLRSYLEQTATLNAARFVDLPLDDIRIHLLDLFKKALNAYCGMETSEGKA